MNIIWKVMIHRGNQFLVELEVLSSWSFFIPIEVFQDKILMVDHSKYPMINLSLMLDEPPIHCKDIYFHSWTIIVMNLSLILSFKLPT